MSGDVPELIANIGQFVLSKHPDVLVCLGLGSCVGVALFQDSSNFVGLMHVMLPKSSGVDESKSNYYKYADVGIPLLVEELVRKGCFKDRLRAKIAGGAHMFRNTLISETMDIGARNIDAVRAVLMDLGIKIVAEDVGGSVGRTMRVNCESGEVVIKTKDGSKII